MLCTILPSATLQSYPPLPDCTVVYPYHELQTQSALTITTLSIIFEACIATSYTLWPTYSPVYKPDMSS